MAGDRKRLHRFTQHLRHRFMSAEQAVGVAEPVEETVRQRQERQAEKPKQQPRYHVILWNDDDHTYDYVIKMVQELFGHPFEKGYEVAREVDTRGRAILLTTTKEHAELKRDQVHAYGKDREIKGCKGSMSATIEPEC
jgi:ATP-dependent Clp protease adaptor protein ClpS